MKGISADLTLSCIDWRVQEVELTPFLAVSAAGWQISPRTTLAGERGRQTRNDLEVDWEAD